jgi:hypothetical protein
MAKTAAKRPAASKAAAPKKSGGGGLRPAFLAAGLGLFWFVEYQDAGGAEGDMVMWNYLAVLGVRLLADFVGAWVLISAAHLVFALGRYGITYLRSMWVQQESS